MNNNSKVEELVSKLGESVVSAINEAHRKVLTEAVSAESEITLRDAFRKVLVECGYTQAPDDFRDIMHRGVRRVSLRKIVEHPDPVQALYESMQYPNASIDSHEVHRLAAKVSELQDTLEKSCEKYRKTHEALLGQNIQVERLIRILGLTAVTTPLAVAVDKVESMRNEGHSDARKAADIANVWDTRQLPDAVLQFKNANVQYGHFVRKLARALGWTVHEIKLDEVVHEVAGLVRWKQEALVVLNRWDMVDSLVRNDPSLTIGDSVVDKAIEMVKAYDRLCGEVKKWVAECRRLQTEAALSDHNMKVYAKRESVALKKVEEVSEQRNNNQRLINEATRSLGLWGAEGLVSGIQKLLKRANALDEKAEEWKAEAERWRNLVTVQNDGMHIVSARDIPYQEEAAQEDPGSRGLNFATALAWMQEGCKVRRIAWPAGKYLALCNGEITCDCGVVVIVESSCILATDWEVCA